MQITNKDDLKVGMEVFKVHSLGRSSFLTKYEILSKPYHQMGESFNHWVYTSVDDKYNKEVSLMDCNVIPNTYNDHKLFDDKEEAEQYLKECLK